MSAVSQAHARWARWRRSPAAAPRWMAGAAPRSDTRSCPPSWSPVGKSAHADSSTYPRCGVLLGPTRPLDADRAAPGRDLLLTDQAGNDNVGVGMTTWDPPRDTLLAVSPGSGGGRPAPTEAGPR